jgi:hypothetical protein
MLGTIFFLAIFLVVLLYGVIKFLPNKFSPSTLNLLRTVRNTVELAIAILVLTSLAGCWFFPSETGCIL